MANWRKSRVMAVAPPQQGAKSGTSSPEKKGLLHTKHNLKKNLPPFLPLPPPPTREKGTSHLDGNSIPKIGCHYFWPGLIALPKNTLPIVFQTKK